jgi:hypothetical protein
MKNILIAATLAGTAIAVLIYYYTGKGHDKVMNIEDGLPIEY